MPGGLRLHVSLSKCTSMQYILVHYDLSLHEGPLKKNKDFTTALTLLRGRI